MTIANAQPAAGSRAPSPDASPDSSERARISFRQPVSTAGFIDAAWWPRTRDLTVEVPPLMDVLWTAGRDINRITYNMHAWDPAPRRLRIDGRSVRLGGFTIGDPTTVALSDAWGRERVEILVIAPDTDPARAQRIFDLVSDSTNLYSAAQVLELAADTSPATADSAATPTNSADRSVRTDSQSERTSHQ